MKNLYRYIVAYPSGDNDLHIWLAECRVVKETEKSYLIENSPYRSHTHRWVRKNSLRSYAHDSKEKALEHLKHRLKKQIHWNEFWLENQREALAMLDNEDLVFKLLGK